MQVAGYIMEGDPQLPSLDGPGGYEFVDWGKQPDGAYISPCFQGKDTEEESARCFGIHRDEPCGCYRQSVRLRFKAKVNNETGEVLEWGYLWNIQTIEECGKHKCEPKFEPGVFVGEPVIPKEGE